MSKIKILSILVATLFVCSAVASISGAEELEGRIEVEITQWIGLVSPVINVTENQTGLSLKVDVDENGSATVNDNLTIKINVTDNSNRGELPFFLPRLMFASVFVINNDAKIMPELLGYFGRLIRARVSPLKGRVRVDDGDTLLNVSMNYRIDNTTLMENMTMHIIVMGFIPGNINGLDGIPIISHMKVNLGAVAYDYPE